jgi:O-antigen/teichoic acid export membrane protein
MSGTGRSYRLIGSIAFITSILAGLGQFLGLLVLNHILDKDSFSRVSLVLHTFPIFLIIVELGIQGDVIRRISKAGPQEVVPQVLCFRLILSIIAVISTLVYAYFAQISAFLMWGILGFSLSYIPISILLSLEELGYATRDMLFVILYRLSRLLAIVSFIALATLIAYPFQAPVALSPDMYYWIFLIYPASICGLAGFGIVRLKRQNFLHRTSRQRIWQLIHSLRHLIASTGFRWLGGYLFSVLVVATLGETNLSSYNLANILMTPLSLFIQVMINVTLAKIFSQKESGTFEKRLPLVGLIFLLAVSGYTLFGSLPFVVNLIFERFDYSEYLRLFIPLSLAQFFVAFSSVINIMAIDQQKYRIIITNTALYSLTIIIFSPIVKLGYLDRYVTVAVFSAGLVGFLYHLAVLPKLKPTG